MISGAGAEAGLACDAMGVPARKRASVATAIVAGVVVAQLGSGPDARAADAPNLSVTATTQPPASVPTGGKVTLQARIRNGGSAAAAASTTEIVLSVDDQLGAGDVPLGAVATPALAVGASTEVSLTGEVDAVPDGAYFVLVCADSASAVAEAEEGDNCRASGELVDVVAATSDDLVRRAVSSGTIGKATGLLYRMYAMFEDGRLPAAYQAARPTAEQVAATYDDVMTAWSGLSGRVQRRIDPFLRPPAYAGSASRLQPLPSTGRRSASAAAASCFPPGVEDEPQLLGKDDGWAKMSTPHFVIWYPIVDTIQVDKEGALEVATWSKSVLESIWTKVTRFYARDPLSDARVRCNGGSGKVDLYVVNPPFDDGGSAATPYPPGCAHRPGYLTVSPGHAGTLPDTRDLLTFAFAQLVQLGYTHPKPCAEYRWLEDATATWMIDHVYPADNLEHFEAPRYLERGHAHPLEQGKGVSAYLFLQFLARDYRPSRIADAWRATESTTSLRALDSALPGGFAETWSEFGKLVWNRADLDLFHDWDDLSETLSPTTVLRLAADDYRTRYPLTTRRTVGHLSLNPTLIIPDYFADSVTLRDFGFEGLGYDGDSLEGDTSGRITATMLTQDGSTFTEDWTDLESRTFCREKPGEDVVEIWLTHSNATFKDRRHRLNFPERGAEVVLSVGACKLPQTLWLVAKGTYTDGDLVETWEGEYLFELDDEQSGVGHYTAVDGVVDWELNGTAGQCGVGEGAATYSGELSWEDTPFWGVTLRGSSSDALGEPNTYYLNLHPGPRGTTVQRICPGGTTTVGYEALNAPSIATTGEADLVWDRGGAAGSLSYKNSWGKDIEWSWAFGPGPDG